MAKKAIVLGASGWTSSVSGTDILANVATAQGWTQALTKSFEFYTKGDMVVSVNGGASVMFPAGTEYETEDIIESFKLLTTGVEYWFLAKF